MSLLRKSTGIFLLVACDDDENSALTRQYMLTWWWHYRPVNDRRLEKRTEGRMNDQPSRAYLGSKECQKRIRCFLLVVGRAASCIRLPFWMQATTPGNWVCFTSLESNTNNSLFKNNIQKAQDRILSEKQVLRKEWINNVHNQWLDDDITLTSATVQYQPALSVTSLVGEKPWLLLRRNLYFSSRKEGATGPRRQEDAQRSSLFSPGWLVHLWFIGPKEDWAMMVPLIILEPPGHCTSWIPNFYLHRDPKAIPRPGQ